MIPLTIHMSLLEIVLLLALVYRTALALYRTALQRPHGLADRIWTRWVMRPLLVWVRRHGDDWREWR